MTAPQASGGGTQDAEGEGGWHHFWVIRQTRDDVIAGDLDAARARLRRIAAGDVGEDIPFEWTVWIEEMQEEAERAERAKSALALARIVTAVSARCGECHRSLRHGPAELGLERLEQMSQGRAGVKPESADHGWAADELWLGMTIPIHQAWVRGSEALTQSPLHGAMAEGSATTPAVEPQAGAEPASPNVLASSEPSEPGEPIVEPRSPDRFGPQTARKLRALRGVGERLYDAGRPLPMAKAYADFIARCSGCHEG